MSNEPTKQSVYADYLYAKIDEWFEQGRAAFTIKEMSKFTGLKPTPNFRRRIRHCVAKGTLEVTTIALEPKGSCNLYMLKFPF